MTPLESILVGAAGTGPLQPLTVAAGRPPAKLRVVAMRRVTVPEGTLARLNLMVCGLLTSLKRAMAKSLVEEEPTV